LNENSQVKTPFDDKIVGKKLNELHITASNLFDTSKPEKAVQRNGVARSWWRRQDGKSVDGKGVVNEKT